MGRNGGGNEIMNIQVDIERLVVDGLDLGAHGAADLQAALQVHLTRLLDEQGLPGLASASTALPSLRGATVEWAQPAGADLLGRRIADSVHAGLANLHSPTRE